jgi:hypothetical protein
MHDAHMLQACGLGSSEIGAHHEEHQRCEERDGHDDQQDLVHAPIQPALGSGFGVYGVWFMVWVYGVWCMVYDLWFMVYGLWFMVYALWFMVYGLWFMVHGLWFMV